MATGSPRDPLAGPRDLTAAAEASNHPEVDRTWAILYREYIVVGSKNAAMLT